MTASDGCHHQLLTPNHKFTHQPHSPFFFLLLLLSIVANDDNNNNALLTPPLNLFSLLLSLPSLLRPGSEFPPERPESRGGADK